MMLKLDLRSIYQKLPSSCKPTIKRIYFLLRRNFNQNELEQPQVLGQTHVDKLINLYIKRHKRMSHIIRTPFASFNTLNILFIVPWLKVGGADKVNLELVREFTKRGHQVHIFTTLSDSHPWHDKFESLTPRITHLGNQFNKVTEMLDFIIEYVVTNQIQVIQISNSQIGYQIARVVKKYLPYIKIIDLLHMEEPYEPFDYFRYSDQFRENIDHRIVITPYLKNVLVNKYNELPERITVIPNGIYMLERNYEKVGYRKKRLEIQDFTIAFVGRMEKQKQPIRFLEVANEIRKRFDHVRFLVVGDGSLFRSAQEYAFNNGLTPYITWLGNRDDVLQILKDRVHLLLAPSLREGLPMIGLEAMSLGIPVVATNVEGWTDLLSDKESGGVLAEDSIDALMKCCVRYVIDVEWCLECSKKAFHYIFKHYDLEKSSAMYLELYRRLLQGGK